MGKENFIPGGDVCQLWEGGAPGFDPTYCQLQPTVSFFPAPDRENCGAVIACPGGGYTRKAAHEAIPVADWLNSNGISAFVLDYRVTPYRHPCALLDIQRAVRYVRFHAARFRVDPSKIAVLGFSAGGHLASSVGTHFDSGINDAPDLVDRISCRPDAMVLCYPVISFTSWYHQGSRNHLLGPGAPYELCKQMSNELQVSAATPPTFLWHTADDDGVAVQNSMLFAEALGRCNVPFELHILPHGPHGVGLADDHPRLAVWKDLAITWLRSIGW